MGRIVGIDQELAEIRDISREELIVGFHHPSMREYSEGSDLEVVIRFNALLSGGCSRG
jgi:hypothetical protein